MPDVFVAAPSSEYTVVGHFRVWSGFRHNEVPVQSYKLHVSATAESATDVAQIILPELRRLKIPHKIAATLGDYRSMNAGTQAGKFITVYPRSAGEGRRLRLLMGRKLRIHGFGGRNRFIAVEGEASLGMSGGVYTRYGANVRIPYNKGGLGLFKTNDLGQAVDKTGQPLLYRNKPVNLGEPFPAEERENIMNLLYSEGVIEPDNARGWPPRHPPREPWLRQLVSLLCHFVCDGSRVGISKSCNLEPWREERPHTAEAGPEAGSHEHAVASRFASLLEGAAVN